MRVAKMAIRNKALQGKQQRSKQQRAKHQQSSNKSKSTAGSLQTGQLGGERHHFEQTSDFQDSGSGYQNRQRTALEIQDMLEMNRRQQLEEQAEKTHGVRAVDQEGEHQGQQQQQQSQDEASEQKETSTFAEANSNNPSASAPGQKESRVSNPYSPDSNTTLATQTPIQAPVQSRSLSNATRPGAGTSDSSTDAAGGDVDLQQSVAIGKKQYGVRGWFNIGATEIHQATSDAAEAVADSI